jgi:3-deoxy-D-manno-octulosonic-acid transferase
VLLLYNFLLTLLWPLLYLYPPFRGTVNMRLGHFPLEGYDPRRPGLKLLINAVSAGEVVAISSFIREIRQRLPDCQIVLLTTTDSGRQMALSRLGGLIDLCAYFPLVDLPFLARRYLRRLRPALYITTEAELWPNIQLACHSRGIPVVLVNARLYLHNKRGIRGWVVRRLYEQCNLILCQDERQRDNFLRFGIDRARLIATGNIKFDFALEQWEMERFVRWRRQLGLDQERLIVAGSTHPGEEALLLNSYSELRRALPGLRLLLAPRHVERADELFRLARQHELRCLRLSELLPADQQPGELAAAAAPPQWDVLIADRYGVLVDCYRVADLVVMGGTFHPKVGGHNILEATSLGKPVLVGPHIYGIAAQVEMLAEHQALLRAESVDPRELARKLREVLEDREAALQTGARALEATLANRGAARRAVEAVLQLSGTTEAQL